MAAGIIEIAKEMIKQMIPGVEGVLTSGSSSLSMVRWRGNLKYRIEEIHGKVMMEGSNSEGGTIGVCKRDSALIGAEHNVIFERDGKDVAKVYLCTYYSGAQPQAQLVYGDESFVKEVVTGGSSTGLILIYKPDVKPQRALRGVMASAPVAPPARDMAGEARDILAKLQCQSPVALVRYRGDAELRVNIKHFKGKICSQKQDDDHCGGYFAICRHLPDKESAIFYLTFFRDGHKLAKVCVASLFNMDEPHKSLDQPHVQMIYGQEYFDRCCIKEKNGSVLCISMKKF